MKNAILLNGKLLQALLVIVWEPPKNKMMIHGMDTKGLILKI